MHNAVRAALLSGSVPPSLDDDTEEAWLAVLSGAQTALAQQAIERDPAAEMAFPRLRSRWSRLTPTCRTWLVQWGARCYPVAALELLERALTEPNHELQLAAVEAIRKLGAAAELARPWLEPLLRCDDVALRIAAARAGAPGHDWREWAFRGSPIEIRVVGIERMADDEGVQCIPELMLLLEDPEWQVQSAAAQALAHFEEGAAEHVRTLLSNPNAAVRVAAARVLFALGRDEWLRDEPTP